MIGRGGWSWYTGSSGWYYIAGIQYILGLNICENKIILNPCIPNSWEEYSIQYKYGNSVYNIKVKNEYKSNQVRKLKINGEEKKDKIIQLIDNNKIYDIEAIV